MPVKRIPKGEAGDLLLGWKVDEYTPHDRGTWWHVIAVVVGLILIMYSFVTLNFLFALIVVIFGLIVAFSASRPPAKVAVAITRDGVQIGERFTRFRDIARFWIVYEPGEVKSLYFDFKGFIRPHLAVPLDTTDPNEVRQVLRKYIDEDLEQHDEPLADYLGRKLKL